MWPLWLVEISLQHIQKNAPRLLPKPAKFEKNPPNGYRVIRKAKCGAGGAAGAGGAWRSPIHKQASLAGRLFNFTPRHYTLPPSSWCPKYQHHTCTIFQTEAGHDFQTEDHYSKVKCQIEVPPWHCTPISLNKYPYHISTSYSSGFLRYRPDKLFFRPTPLKFHNISRKQT